MTLLEQKMIQTARAFLGKLQLAEEGGLLSVLDNGVPAEELNGIELLASFAKVQPSAMSTEARRELISIAEEAQQILNRMVSAAT